MLKMRDFFLISLLMVSSVNAMDFDNDDYEIGFVRKTVKSDLDEPIQKFWYYATQARRSNNVDETQLNLKKMCSLEKKIKDVENPFVQEEMAKEVRLINDSFYFQLIESLKKLDN